MTNILLNTENFDEDWASPTLTSYINPQSRVLLMPLSYQEGWASDEDAWRERYQEPGEEINAYYRLARPFHAYGIPDEQIHFFDYYEVDRDRAPEKLQDVDIVYLAGRHPELMMNSLVDLGLDDALRQFPGVIMGSQAGALIQLEHYPIIPDLDHEFGYGDGLGLVHGFMADMDYDQDSRHLYAIIRGLEDYGQPVVCVPGKGGIVVDQGTVDMLGDAAAAAQDDLDALYQALDDARVNEYRNQW